MKIVVEDIYDVYFDENDVGWFLVEVLSWLVLL